MSGRYERVNTQDDDPDTPTTPSSLRPQPIPNSPPPSFHSRASSAERRRQNVDPTLADAFDAEDDDSDDEPDDRQRLVRGNSYPISSNSTTRTSDGDDDRPSAPGGQSAQWSSAGTNAQQAGSRVYGGGIQSDGVFSNMTARPERGEKIVEEQPPVCFHLAHSICALITNASVDV